LAEFNKTGEFKLSKQGQWPPQKFSAYYTNTIYDIISSANKSGLQLTLQMIVFELSELNFFISKVQLSHDLKNLGYYYGKGEWQNILHKFPQNIAYRTYYLHKRFENFHNKNDIPDLLKVFLDESYCNMQYNRSLTWLPKDGVVCEKEKGLMLVIFGVIIVFQNGVDNQIK
ncbi:6494_t:CDS:1, partial [Scutellospora calospora]